MHKQSQPRDSFAASHQQVGVQPLPEKQGWSCIMVSWQDEHHHSECPPLPPSLPQLLKVASILGFVLHDPVAVPSDL